MTYDGYLRFPGFPPVRGVGEPITAVESEAALFFYDHAAYSTPPGREQCARDLAEAEDWARRAGVKFRWEDDWEIGSHRDYFGPDSVYENYEPSSCESCTATLGRDVVASLGCIDDADNDYRRVIEAELAEEARALILSDLMKL
jgi:hypothetical protein